MKLSTLADSALRLLFPTRCVLCGRENDLVCAPCRRLFPPRLDPDAVPRPPGARAARAVWPYENEIRKIVSRYKYNGLRSLAPVLALEMASVLKEWDPAIDVIVNVPVHPSRRRERGFDQAELLAQELARLSGAPFTPALTRVRETTAQARAADSTQRARNVLRAFEVAHRESIQRADILLVDDVLTTGATLGEAGQTLRRAGAKTVYVLTLAHET